MWTPFRTLHAIRTGLIAGLCHQTRTIYYIYGSVCFSDNSSPYAMAHPYIYILLYYMDCNLCLQLMDWTWFWDGMADCSQTCLRLWTPLERPLVSSSMDRHVPTNWVAPFYGTHHLFHLGLAAVTSEGLSVDRQDHATNSRPWTTQPPAIMRLLGQL